ncbi:hypothetical protein [Neolewinella antarctica]|uniref:Uncharacterized protein n=1 Tax=Neolewinella antarctica TaxID=442734 RepID=A0ABX0X8F7_9BACT|nr:hypothetical protein [Neolewinella antarctica]NJC25128.1 hypothetical protein [Neolewinella antarctica]
MRPLLLALSLLLCTSVRAQISPDSTIAFTPVDLSTHALLTAAPWQELDENGKPSYLLSLNREGNFDEDAQREDARKYRHLLGRWVLDTNTNTVTLSVDGFMGEGLLHSRYRRGRDYYVAYEIIEASQQELQLKDVKTSRIRSFIASDPAAVEDQATKRLPQFPEKDKPSVFTLPDFNGGF